MIAAATNFLAWLGLVFIGLQVVSVVIVAIAMLHHHWRDRAITGGIRRHSLTGRMPPVPRDLLGQVRWL